MPLSDNSRFAIFVNHLMVSLSQYQEGARRLLLGFWIVQLKYFRIVDKIVSWQYFEYAIRVNNKKQVHTLVGSFYGRFKV